MRMRLVLLVVGLLMAGVVVTGCGDDENSGGDTAAQTDTGGAATTPPAETATEESGGGGGGAANPQAAEQCKQQIQAQPGVSEDLRKDLEDICEKAASGDEKEAREATKEVCKRLIQENVPDGPAREQALATCDQATAAP